MPESCCGKPVTRIIKVADFEAGLIGLDQALHDVHEAGFDGEDEIKQELVRVMRAYGNYISPSRENDYKQALLREFKNYVMNVERKAKKETAITQKR